MELKAIGIAAGLALAGATGTAQAEPSLLDQIMMGPVNGLQQSLTEANLQPLIDGTAGFNSGLVQGTTGGSVHDVLTGLNTQNPALIQKGLSDLGAGVTDDVIPALIGDGTPALPSLPGGGGGLPALPEIPGLGSLPALPGLPEGGGAPGLPEIPGVADIPAL